MKDNKTKSAKYTNRLPWGLLLLPMVGYAMLAFSLQASNGPVYPAAVWDIVGRPKEARKPVKKVVETVYYIKLKFTQSSFTLDIGQHIKDAANSFYVTLPTTKRFYDSVEKGDLLNSKFKTATFLLNGNIGSRKVYVEDKFIKTEMFEDIEK